MKSLIASAFVTTYVAAQQNLDQLTWGYCDTDQFDWACDIFCEDYRSFDWITQSQVNQACKWRDAATQTADVNSMLCFEGDPDLCAYVCKDAENGNSSYADVQTLYACNNDEWPDSDEHDYSVSEITTLWNMCKNQQQADICGYICEDQIDFLLTRF